MARLPPAREIAALPRVAAALRARVAGRWLYAVALVLLLAGSALHYQRGYYYPGAPLFHGLGADDAYISFRYGWNLVHFGRLAWNESGYRQTEGFTNPLWVAVSAAWSLLNHKDWVYPLVVVTSVIGAALLLLVLMRAVRAASGGQSSALTGLVLLAAAPVVWLHTTSGLESGLFGLGLGTLAFLALFAPAALATPRFVVGLAALLCLLRSDGFVFVVILSAGALLAGQRAWRPLLISVALTTALSMLWRLAVFGAFAPNTAVAKMNFSLPDRLPWGLVILWLSVASGLGAFLVLGSAGLAWQPARRRAGAALVLLGWLGYFAYIGGDLYLERHLMGVLVFAAALSAPLWVRLGPRWRVLGLVLALAAVVGWPLAADPRFAYAAPKPSDPWVALGLALAQDRQRYGVVLISPAGKIPYFAGGDFIDEYGLNDPDLAAQTRDSFVPGHSAGSLAVALDLARTHPSGRYARFTYAGGGACPLPAEVGLWVHNRQPGARAQRQVSPAALSEACASTDVYLWSLISAPVSTASAD